MSKLNQIQNALEAIDQANFQKLCDAYLHRTHNAISISAVGSVAGENKTRVGQPDTILTLDTGKNILVEATTEKNGLLQKFSSDLDKCLDENETGIPLVEIEKVILACNRKFSQKDKSQLLSKGREKDVVVELIDLDKLSFELHHKFQPLAKEFLGVELDTGQILTSQDFVEEYQKSKFATPLDNDFFFREGEKQQIIDALEERDLLLITGKAGVGKSKLALECVKQFVETHRDFQDFCITSKNLDLYKNLKAYFGPDGYYIVIVDDANRLSQLPHILQMLREHRENRRLKIILTVRDYALGQVKNLTKNYNFEEIELNTLSREEIFTLLQGEDFGIKNHDYLSRIYDISKGNPRLAIMAARIALEANRLDSINDVSGLYDVYYDSINDDLKEFGSGNLIQVAGIISFFRVLDRNNDEVFEKVAHSFVLSVEELWTGLEKLHEIEIVDLDYEVAKVSDQILATYLFYKSFFKDEVSDFSILLNSFGDRFSQRLIDALNPILDAFDAELIIKVLQPHVDKKWQEIKEDESEALSFIRLFHFLKETEFLVYLKRKIDAVETVAVSEKEIDFVPRKNENVSDKYLGVLRLFSGKNLNAVLEMVFDYLEKNLRLLPQVTLLLTRDFCFQHYSHYQNYWIQQNVITKLIEKSKGANLELYQKILIQISETYLQMHFNSNTSSRMAVTIHKFLLRPCEPIFEIRESLWKRLIEIYQEGKYQSEVLKMLQIYTGTWHADYIDKEIIKKDSEVLLPFVAGLNPASYRNCVIANAYFDYLENVGINVDNSLRENLTNKTFEISEVLLSNDRKQLQLEYEEYQSYKEELLVSFFERYEFDDYWELLNHCKVIQETSESSSLYQLHFSLCKVLNNLADKNPALFSQVVLHIFESGNELGLEGGYLIYNFIKNSSSVNDVYQSIKNNRFLKETNWLFSFFIVLEDDINEDFLNALFELYEKTTLQEIPAHFDFLEKYTAIDRNVVPKIIGSIFERLKNDKFQFNFEQLLSYGDISKNLGMHFLNDLPLLKKIYFYHFKTARYPDLGSKALKRMFLLDNHFLFEFMEFLWEEKNSSEMFIDGRTKLPFIWEQENYKELFTSLLAVLYEKDAKNPYFFRPSFIELTLRDLNDEQKNKALNLLKGLLKENAADKQKASYIFQIVVNCFGDMRKDFVEIFLAANKNLEDFKELDFRINHILVADWGSRIPRLEGRITFFESLLPLLSSVELLEHKLEIEERINSLLREIEHEKKRDFIGDF